MLFFLFNQVIFRFQPSIFQGVPVFLSKQTQKTVLAQGDVQVGVGNKILKDAADPNS